MDKVKIMNYDVLIVRILQLIFPFVSSYVALFVIILTVDGKAIEPIEFFRHIFSFDAKLIALVTAWAVIASVALLIIKGTSGTNIKNSFLMKKWLDFKVWLLTLGNDFD